MKRLRTLAVGKGKPTKVEALRDTRKLTTGKLAKKTGTKLQTIRYCEQVGLVPEPGRTEGGQRRYGDGEHDRLAFIRHARQLGFFA